MAKSRERGGGTAAGEGAGQYEILREKRIKQNAERMHHELYTEEHEKLLGDCKIAWTPSLDGCGVDCNQVKVKSCHQCSLKTLGHHTHCSKCNMVRGQICGDCLYKRYGENVIEAKQNSIWICPVCRGICNCCRCRRSKGWSMLGPIYKKVVSLGYKSAAHYLIQTRRGQAEGRSFLQASSVPSSNLL